METYVFPESHQAVRTFDIAVDMWTEAGYSTTRRSVLFVSSVMVGVLVAGFWSPALVDGWGREFAAFAIGGHNGKADEFAQLGGTFGFVFAFVAGIAATFTACNCVVFGLVPSIVGTGQTVGRRHSGLATLGAMATVVVVMSAVYGAFVGRLGPVGAAAFNTREIRSALSFVTFGSLGIVMILWSAIAFGFLQCVTNRCSAVTRGFFVQPTVQGALVGLMISAFPVGRPFPVFREFLMYAAHSDRADYAAAVMAVQGLAQVAVVSIFVLLLMMLFGERMSSWAARRPQRVRTTAALASAAAMATSGAFLTFYWSVSRLWPESGRWGLQLGWYR